MLSIGEYDERVFLGEDAPDEIGTPAKVLQGQNCQFTNLSRYCICVVDPFHVDADPYSTYHPDADPDSDFLVDAVPDPTVHPDSDPDADPGYQNDADPDP